MATRMDTDREHGGGSDTDSSIATDSSDEEDSSDDEGETERDFDVVGLGESGGARKRAASPPTTQPSADEAGSRTSSRGGETAGPAEDQPIYPASGHSVIAVSMSRESSPASSDSFIFWGAVGICLLLAPHCPHNTFRIALPSAFVLACFVLRASCTNPMNTTGNEPCMEGSRRKKIRKFALTGSALLSWQNGGKLRRVPGLNPMLQSSSSPSS
jgi:hypothetical protein